MQSFLWNSYRAATVAVGLGILAAAPPQIAAAQSPVARNIAPYLALEHRSPDQITPDDAAALRAKQSAIAREAAMFGYDLSAGHWTYDQAVCPVIPDAIVLHERSVSHNGAQSLFTAVVPRGDDRVWVVPILYRDATPWESAIGSERMLSVFNHAVPADLAKQAVQPNGQWLTLAMCFAEIAGAEPRVPQNPEIDAALLSAPPPTLHVSQLHGAMDIEFTGLDAPRQYTVWSITVNGAGRALAAEAHTYPEHIYAEKATAALPPSVPVEPARTETSQPVPAAQPENAQPVETPAVSEAPAAPIPAQTISVQPAQTVVDQPGSAEPAPAPAPAAAAPVAQSDEPVPQERGRKEKRVKEKKSHQKNADGPIEPKVRELPDLPDLPSKPIPN